MRKKILHLIAGVSASVLLLTALFLLLGGMHTNAAPAAIDTAAVRQAAGVALSPGYSQEGEPGTIVAHTHILTNTGATASTFTLEATSSENWPVELLGGAYPDGTALLPLQLGAGLSDTFVVSLTVPADADEGTVDNTVVTARITSSIQATITDTTTVVMWYVYLPVMLRNYPPLWQQATDTVGIKVYDIAVCPSGSDLQYAGTDLGLYRSDDGGATWQHWALDGRVTPVVVNPSNCDEAFGAVGGDGVHRVTGQNQATPVNQGLGEAYLYGLAITENGQTLYAGDYERGVYRTSTSTINWAAVNNDDISDLRIRSLYVISDVLYAGGRKCAFYHSDDWGDSWQKKTVLSGGTGGACGDAQVWAIARLDNALYAGLGLDKGLYRSEDGDTSWTHISDVPTVTIYRFGLHAHQSCLYVSAYGHGVYTCEQDGRCQPLPNGGLGTSDIRGLAIAEIDGTYPRLLAGSDDGIWWVPLVPQEY